MVPVTEVAVENAEDNCAGVRKGADFGRGTDLGGGIISPKRVGGVDRKTRKSHQRSQATSRCEQKIC